MFAGETARKNYESARDELVQRIQLREQILLFFVSGVATIYSVALGAENKLEILLAIPYLAFGATGTVLSLGFLLSAHWWRRKLYREMEWQDIAG